MKCVICKHGTTQPSVTTVTLEPGNLTLVMRGVPAQVCTNCGEAYVNEEVTTRLLRVAEETARQGAQVDVRQYIAAA
jgi:YgiT-type zinc finger domain-containing protein